MTATRTTWCGVCLLSAALKGDRAGSRVVSFRRANEIVDVQVLCVTASDFLS